LHVFSTFELFAVTGDGATDVVVGGYSDGKVVLLQNNGAASFSPLAVVTLQTGIVGVHGGDFDGELRQLLSTPPRVLLCSWSFTLGVVVTHHP
jgi:hypothetical protein